MRGPKLERDCQFTLRWSFGSSKAHLYIGAFPTTGTLAPPSSYYASIQGFDLVGGGGIYGGMQQGPAYEQRPTANPITAVYTHATTRLEIRQPDGQVLAFVPSVAANSSLTCIMVQKNAFFTFE